LEENQQLDQTIVILTSDHGESFNDRKPKTLFHGTNLFQEELHVPLIIRVPSALSSELKLKESNQRINTFVGLTDILPTLFDLLNMKRSPSIQALNGISLLPLLRQETDQTQIDAILSQPIYSELLPYGSNLQKTISMISRDGYKLLKDQSNQQYFYFDLKQDKKEKNNLYLKLKDEISPKVEKLEQYIENL
jgi:hypothetical protein